MDNITNDNLPFEPAKNRLTDLIYTRLLEMTRKEVESFDIGNVDVLLLAVVTLCEYDLRLDRYTALRSHHAGMSVLVSRRGGAHNLGLSLPDVLRMDRFLAVRLNQLPQFNPTVLTSSDVTMRQSTSGLPYGFKLHNWSTSLSGEVLSLCADSAQLLALMDELNVTFEPSRLSASPNPKLEYFHFLRESIDVRHAILNYQCSTAASSTKKDLLVLTATHIVIHYVAYGNYPPAVPDLLATRLWNLLTKATLPTSQALPGTLFLEQSSNNLAYMSMVDLPYWTDNMPMLLWLLFACALPSSRERSLSFAGRVQSGSALFNISRSSSALSHATQSPTDSGAPSCTDRVITSPSTPRRHRHLPNLLLHVAEHLIGERPLSGTSDWDEAIADILISYVWAGDRLSTEFANIIGRVHDGVLGRAVHDG